MVAIGGGGKVGADPGQPCASVRALGQQRRLSVPVEVAAPVRGQKAVGQADLVDGEPDSPRSTSNVHVDSGHPPVRQTTGCDGGAAGDVLASSVDQSGAGEQLLAQEAERRSHPRLFQVQNALQSACRTFHSRLQVIDEKETVGFLRRLLVQPVQLLLRQQSAELLNDGVQLVLVAQPPGTAYSPARLR